MKLTRAQFFTTLAGIPIAAKAATEIVPIKATNKKARVRADRHKSMVVRVDWGYVTGCVLELHFRRGGGARAERITLYETPAIRVGTLIGDYLECVDGLRGVSLGPDTFCRKTDTDRTVADDIFAGIRKRVGDDFHADRIMPGYTMTVHPDARLWS